MLRALPGIFSLLISTLPVHSPALLTKPPPVLPVLAVAETGFCVGPQNKMDHPARPDRRIMQVRPVVKVSIDSKICVSGLAFRNCEYNCDFPRQIGVFSEI